MIPRTSVSRTGSSDGTMTPDEIVRRVKNIIDYDAVLKRVNITGTLSDIKHHSSGHVYFTIKGTQVSLAGVMFRSDAAGVLLWPNAGDRVVVTGSVRLYEARSTVQIYASKIFPLGASQAKLALELLRKKLEAEGLFSPMRKRAIPDFPDRVVCVTSDTGAAVRDVIRQFRTRWPLCELIVVPSLVQGASAAENAVAALRRAYALAPDVLLLVRGGGSKEDLNPFDDEELVREVARCPVPIITGIGHEIDSSLCDLAADSNMPTPTAAAVCAFPDRRAEWVAASNREKRMNLLLTNRMQREASGIENYSRDLKSMMQDAFASRVQDLDSMAEDLQSCAQNRIRLEGARVEAMSRALKNLSPEEITRRGFCYVSHDGRPLTSAAGIKTDDELELQLTDGRIQASVSSVQART